MDVLLPLVEQLATRLLARGWRVATAESCTGGLIAAAMTEIAGSSQWFERGFVTYSNEAKMELLGVDAGTLAAHGAVSEQTVCVMASGALARAHADIAVAVSGIAGPSGGSPEKPVGTVCVAWAVLGAPPGCVTLHLSGDRHAIRMAAAEAALHGLLRIAT